MKNFTLCIFNQSVQSGKVNRKGKLFAGQVRTGKEEKKGFSKFNMS